jgi:hypothetical protein
MVHFPPPGAGGSTRLLDGAASWASVGDGGLSTEASRDVGPAAVPASPPRSPQAASGQSGVTSVGASVEASPPSGAGIP